MDDLLLDGSAEARRLTALSRMEVLDTPEEPAFNEISSTMARSLRAPVAQVSLVDTSRQWAKSHFGPGPREVPRKESFCADVVRRGQIVELADVRADARFVNSPWRTTDPPLLHYAGAPIMTPDGAVGTVCIYGLKPRQLTMAERAVLSGFASLARRLLDGRRDNKEKHRQLQFPLSVLDASPAGILVLDERGIILLTNAAFDRIFGYSPGELINEPLERLLPDALRETHVSLRAQFVAAPETRRMGAGRELLGRKKDGTFIPIEVGLNPMYATEGLRIVASVIDISDRVAAAEAERQAQRALRRYADELSAKNVELDQFAYLTSHDLQAPLRTISNASRMLLEDYLDRLDQPAIRALELQSAAAERMGHLTTQVFEHSRLGRDPACTLVDVRTTVTDVLEDLTATIEASGARIEVGAMPKVNARPVELRMVFQNLIGNAIKFRRPDVPPVVRVTAHPEAPDKRRWRFAVVDNGIGIRAEHFDRIFELFQRLHAKGAFGGLGVGLAHCKKIVATHNGRIWVESTPGKGSTFHFTIGDVSS